MKKIELLLPAGNEDCLRAAVENGADAVYLGVSSFNARRRAKNFLVEDIPAVVEYCHSNGVRVYCVFNILIKNNEVKDFFNMIKKVYLAGVDAVIIQEISFVSMIKKNFKGLEVHLSTQAGLGNRFSLELVKEVDRFILPRELSAIEIKRLIDYGKKIEVFVQGALCFSYSGKCLLSSCIGGRSGNRGLCAQPCRRKYNGKYLLSMKDLCLVEEIPKLIEMGVASLKIEGRLRSPAYVSACAKLYRKAIDSHYSGKFVVDEDLFKEMKLTFNRDFTKGYFGGDEGVVSSERPMGRGLFLGVMEMNGMIKLEEELRVGDGVGIWLPNKVDGAVIKEIELNNEKINEAKAGDKVKLVIHANEGIKLYKTSSVKESKSIHFVKNMPILTVKRNGDSLVLNEMANKKCSNEGLLVKVYNVNDAKNALSEGVKVFYNIFAKDFFVGCSAYIPRILSDEEVVNAAKLMEKFKVTDVLTGNLGAYALLNDKRNLNLYLDYSLNVFNDYDLKFFDKAIPVVSSELSLRDLKDFKNKEMAVMVQGKIAAMNTLYSGLPSILRDEKGYVFKVRKEAGYYQILNSKELGLVNEVLKLREIGVRRWFLDLDNDVIKKIKWYKQLLSGRKVDVSVKEFTKGSWLKGVV
ncbi:U32 family peptidase [Candidatus Woesearchaeota archaeon]|nr:U32 family peptidase [Candidatus Woesearchaeota archaeon]